MTTTNDRYVLAAVKRCVDHWSQRKRAFPNDDAEALLSAIEMAYAEGLKAATPPKGHVLDDTGTVRKVLGALPITADGCVVGDVPDHGAMVFLNTAGDHATPYRMTLCVRCIADPDDESKEWEVVENGELSAESRHWYSTREAAESARQKEPQQ